MHKNEWVIIIIRSFYVYITRPPTRGKSPTRSHWRAGVSQIRQKDKAGQIHPFPFRLLPPSVKMRQKYKRKLNIRERIWYSKWEHSARGRIWRFRRMSWTWESRRPLEREQRLQRGWQWTGAWIETGLWSCTRRENGHAVQLQTRSKWGASPVSNQNIKKGYTRPKFSLDFA